MFPPQAVKPVEHRLINKIPIWRQLPLAPWLLSWKSLGGGIVQLDIFANGAVHKDSGSVALDVCWAVARDHLGSWWRLGSFVTVWVSFICSFSWLIMLIVLISRLGWWLDWYCYGKAQCFYEWML
jgi:hypothetical protein